MLFLALGASKADLCPRGAYILLLETDSCRMQVLSGGEANTKQVQRQEKNRGVSGRVVRDALSEEVTRE